MSSPALEPDATHNNVGDPNVEYDSNAKDGDWEQIAEACESNTTAKFITALEYLQAQIDHGRPGPAELLLQYNQIKHHINQGVDVNARNHERVAALVIAIKAWRSALQNKEVQAAQCCMGIIRELLDQGADLNVQDQNGRTPLVLAIQTRAPDMIGISGMDKSLVNLLVEAGAYLDPPSQYDSTWPTTPLIAAVSEKRLDTVELLLSKKAKVNTWVGGRTGLYTAVCAGEELFPNRVSAFVSTLLRHGADVKSDERRILASAISHSPESVERFLYECYGSPQPELYPNDQLELSGQESHEAPAATSTSVHLPPLGDGRKPVREKLRKVYRSLVERQKDARSLMKWLGGSIHTHDGRVEELCSSCRAFEKGEIYREWVFHSPDSKSVYRSILGGCTMCQLIKDCLPDSFGAVSLYYYSALSESDTMTKNYYERIIVRGQILNSANNFIYGELRLATVDDETASTLTRVSGYDDQETNSEPAFQLVSHWMATCINNHGSACQIFRDTLPSLPTRVIDVGPRDGSKDPHLFISKGKQGNYITLSYCWGNKANLCTESRTLESFTKLIPLLRIPKTIQEAIITTRRLGIQYLWVDTLCILQDSVEDWLREAKNIASVYRNSILTIAAADSVDSEGGLFRKRIRLRTRPVQIAPRIAPFSKMGSLEFIFAFGDRQESNDGIRCESRLDKRGWVLQEQLLSPRTLNFSSQELYWECPALLASESYPAGIPRDHDHNFERRYFTELKMKISGSNLPSDRDRVHMLWQHILVLYSKRELSRETDKLVALAGAANQVSKTLEDKLLAGIWIKWLWRDLLWWVDVKTSTVVPLGARPKEFKAPSWSWASIKGPISYRFPQGTSHLRYYPCIQVLGHGEKVHTKSNRVSGFITIRGVILPATIPGTPSHWASDHLKPGPGRTTTQLRTTWSKSENTSQAPIWKPDTEDIICEDIQCLIVAASHQYIVSIGLMPTGRRPDEYSRVGLAYWSPYYYSIPDEVQFQIITIV